MSEKHNEGGKIEQLAVSDVTPSLSSALPVWLIKILRAPLNNQYTHFIRQPFFFFLSLRPLDIWAFIVFHQSLLLVCLQQSQCLFVKGNSTQLHSIFPFCYNKKKTAHTHRHNKTTYFPVRVAALTLVHSKTTTHLTMARSQITWYWTHWIKTEGKLDYTCFLCWGCSRPSRLIRCPIIW